MACNCDVRWTDQDPEVDVEQTCGDSPAAVTIVDLADQENKQSCFELARQWAVDNPTHDWVWYQFDDNDNYKVVRYDGDLKDWTYAQDK